MDNGRQNIYTIEKDGREFFLTPLVEGLEEYGEVIIFWKKECVNMDEGKNMKLEANAIFDRGRTIETSRESDLQTIEGKNKGVRKNALVWKRKVDDIEF